MTQFPTNPIPPSDIADNTERIWFLGTDLLEQDDLHLLEHGVDVSYQHTDLYGAMLLVWQEDADMHIQEFRDAGYSERLVGIMREAARRGYMWVLFDADIESRRRDPAEGGEGQITVLYNAIETVCTYAEFACRDRLTSAPHTVRQQIALARRARKEMVKMSDGLAKICAWLRHLFETDRADWDAMDAFVGACGFKTVRQQVDVARALWAHEKLVEKAKAMDEVSWYLRNFRDGGFRDSDWLSLEDLLDDDLLDDDDSETA